MALFQEFIPTFSLPHDFVLTKNNLCIYQVEYAKKSLVAPIQNSFEEAVSPTIPAHINTPDATSMLAKILATNQALLAINDRIFYGEFTYVKGNGYFWQFREIKLGFNAGFLKKEDFKPIAEKRATQIIDEFNSAKQDAQEHHQVKPKIS